MMAFSMLCWKNINSLDNSFDGAEIACGGRGALWRRRVLRPGAGFLLLCLVGFVPGAMASSATITDAHAEVREDMVYLDVDLKLAFDPEMVEAMQNAIPINLTLQAVIDEPRDWWMARTIAADDRHYRLEFHALSKTWLVTDVLEHEARSYSTLDGALRSMQRVRAWPICSAQRLVAPAHLVGRVRMVLDINKLPLPLRFPALFDSRWTLSSNWFLWSVPQS
ncbi:MAG: DUF4390 domain-containing protein [Halothiobacillus sp.]